MKTIKYPSGVYGSSIQYYMYTNTSLGLKRFAFALEVHLQ